MDFYNEESFAPCCIKINVSYVDYVPDVVAVFLSSVFRHSFHCFHQASQNLKAKYA